MSCFQMKLVWNALKLPFEQVDYEHVRLIRRVNGFDEVALFGSFVSK
jgi:hypothetical protein